MRILITGCAGFIGFHAAQALLQRGDFIIGYDDFNPYYDPALKQARAERLRLLGILIVEADICEQYKLEELLAQHQITHVLHLGAQAGVRYSLSHPEAYVHSNLIGFIRLLEAIKKFPHVPLIYASSSSVYGDLQELPFSEQMRTDSPISLYGATKKCNEVIAHAYHHLFGIRTTGLRFFTVYGPFGRPDMAYFSFTKSILEGTPITVYDEGKPKRDFTYIDDIVQGIISALDLSAPYELFNLGNHHPHSVMELIQILEKLLGKTARLEFHPLAASDVPITYASSEKSAKLLGFYPTTSLEKGLAHFTKWYTSFYLG